MGQSQKTVEVGRESNPRLEFLAATLTMSWQLAIVVLVPIIGGFELDRKTHTAPLLTIVGFILAMIGTGVIVWRQLQLVTPPPVNHKEPRS